MIFQLTFMFLISYLAEVITGKLPFFMPSSLLSSFIIFLLLKNNLLDYTKIEKSFHLSSKYMAMVFIPAGVSIMTYFSKFDAITWLKILIVGIVSTVLTMVFAAKTNDMVSKYE